jgi:hypothetical protein
VTSHVLSRVWLATARSVRANQWGSLRRLAAKAAVECFYAALIPLGFVLALVIRAISPWLLVRVKVMMSERVGHLAGNTEIYLCARDARMNEPGVRHVDLWYHNWPISNRQLARMWQRQLHIWPAWLLKPVDRMNRVLPGAVKHQIGANAEMDRDVFNLLERFPPHLKFTADEEARGQAGLRDLGIPAGVPFVCLNVRDSSYLERSVPWKDWGYHSYRNSRIDNYVTAAQELAGQGYYVVRMGSLVKEPLPVADPRIIDYATNGRRSDFMDVYLSARAAFFISTGTGLDAIAMVFRRPYLFVNCVPVEHVHTHSHGLMFIPQGSLAACRTPIHDVSRNL